MEEVWVDIRIHESINRNELPDEDVLNKDSWKKIMVQVTFIGSQNLNKTEKCLNIMILKKT